jgi:hypothetical protein
VDRADRERRRAEQRRPRGCGRLRAAVALVVVLAAAVALVVVATGGSGTRDARGLGAAPPAQADSAAPSRTRAQKVAERPEITVVVGGDVALSARSTLPSDGLAGLGVIREPLQKADLAIVNLEGTLGTNGTSKCGTGATNCHAFQAPPSIAGQLHAAGVDVVNLANNHSLDAGPAGAASTRAALDAAKVHWVGPQGTTAVLDVQGTKVALVGMAPYAPFDDLRDLDQVEARVRDADRRADVVIVVIHAGREGADATRTPAGHEVAFGEDRGDTRQAAHTTIDAGADLVVGSGPHVVRGIQRYHGRLIAYSVGNLVGNGTLGISGDVGRCVLLRVRLGADGTIRSGDVVPLTMQPAGQPHRDPERRAIALMNDASRRDFGPTAVFVGRDDTLHLRR